MSADDLLNMIYNELNKASQIFGTPYALAEPEEQSLIEEMANLKPHDLEWFRGITKTPYGMRIRGIQ